MDQLYIELFRSMSQFRKLNIGAIVPELSRVDFMTMNAICELGEDGKILISELAAKTKVLPPSVSRTLRGLEDKGYVERTVNKEDRRNTYVRLTAEGEQVVREARKTLCEYGKAVMTKVGEKDMKRLIAYLNNIYIIAQKELDDRKKEDRKGKENEQNI